MVNLKTAADVASNFHLDGYTNQISGTRTGADGFLSSTEIRNGIRLITGHLDGTSHASQRHPLGSEARTLLSVRLRTLEELLPQAIEAEASGKPGVPHMVLTAEAKALLSNSKDPFTEGLDADHLHGDKDGIVTGGEVVAQREAKASFQKMLDSIAPKGPSGVRR